MESMKQAEQIIFISTVFISAEVQQAERIIHLLLQVRRLPIQEISVIIFFIMHVSNSGSTGKHYAVTVAGTAPNPSGLTINNNIYLANGSGGVFGLFNGSDVANLSAWQTAVGQDAGSFSFDPKYISPNGSSSSVDLHINPSVATVVEGNGYDARYYR
jgi:hypothetical protein